MNKYTIKILISVIFLINVKNVVSSEDKFTPIVNTESGKVQGICAPTNHTCTYYAFKGIPYAEPPIGDLRFRAPVPHRGWDGVLNATVHRAKCAHCDYIKIYSGKEDCLFLNVYTTRFNESLPVMVWIHGGSYSQGSGNDDNYGPLHLVTEDVVVVTFNYRLGILGFLSTGDKYSPGNYAFKDMVLALKWIQMNIKYFGGNPNSVTIFGESSGGGSVHLLMISPLAKNLFHRAIAQSGSALCPWSFNSNPQKSINLTVVRLGMEPPKNNEQLVNDLRKMSVEDLAFVNPTWIESEIPRGLFPLPYGPTADPSDSEEEIFLSDHPRRLLESGQINDVPFIIGHTDAEYLFIVYESLIDTKILDTLNDSPSLMVPIEWNMNNSTPEIEECGNELKNFYLFGQNLSESNIFDYAVYYTDYNFIFGIDETVRLQSLIQKEPIYRYVFSFDGDLNLIKTFTMLSAYPGAVHGDDLNYLFHRNSQHIAVNPRPKTIMVRSQMIKMWTNFAKTGNPTPVIDNIIRVKWPRTQENFEYLDIGDKLRPGKNAMGDRMEFWYNLRKRCAKNKYKING